MYLQLLQRHLIENTGGTVAAPWYWRDIEIEPQCIAQAQGQCSSTTTTTTAAAANAVKPSVHFVLPSPAIISTPSPNQTPSNNQQSLVTSEIFDLCNTLKSQQSSETALGFLNDQTWKHYIHVAVHCNRPIATRTIMSLRDITSKRLPGDLSTKEKRALALKMALAVLQLHDTPWIDSDYGHRSVYFITDASGPHIPLFEPAYVSRFFVATNPPNKTPTVQSDGRTLAKNALLYALGVALIELSYGQPLLTFALPTELDAQGNETSKTEMLVAGRLLQTMRDRELVNYAWATACCVQCDLGYPFDYSLNDDTFRAKFIEKVVVPLRDDYDQIFP